MGASPRRGNPRVPPRASSLARNPRAPSRASPRRGDRSVPPGAPRRGRRRRRPVPAAARQRLPAGRRCEDQDRAVAAPGHAVHRLSGRVDQQHAITGVRQPVADPPVRHDDELHVPRQLVGQRLAAPDDQVRARGQRRRRDRVLAAIVGQTPAGQVDRIRPRVVDLHPLEGGVLRAASGGGADLRDLGTGRRLGKHPGRRGRRRSDLRRHDATGAQQREGARHARPPRPASAPTPAGPDRHGDSFVRRRAGWRESRA